MGSHQSGNPRLHLRRLQSIRYTELDCTGHIYWWYMSSAATLKERRWCPHWSMNLCVRDSMPITPRHPKGPVLFHHNTGKETWRWEVLYCVYYRFNARYWEGNFNINFHPTDRKGNILSSLRNSVDFKNIYLKLPCTLERFLRHYCRYVERKVMLQLNDECFRWIRKS